MYTNENLNDWLQNFDILKYPTQVYNELVVEGDEHTNKLAIMGAWKTGALRESVDGTAFTDKFGKRYRFTNRWKPEAPVGYNTWHYILKNQELIKYKVPTRFTDTQPAVVNELMKQPGFGFIWTQFVLHCFYPETYPIYDQHVYRAYIYMTTMGQEITGDASKNWSDYASYRQFFLEKLQITSLNYWELDRALWAFGKSLKLTKTITSAGITEQLDKSEIAHSTREAIAHEDGWRWDLTLGDENNFWWKFGEQSSLHIIRQFKNSNYKASKIITPAELDKIYDYMQGRGWTYLANNVQNLKLGTEKEGLGRFLYDDLKWNPTHAQLASHIAAIHVHAGVWRTKDNKKKNIQFEALDNDWRSGLKSYYFGLADDD